MATDTGDTYRSAVVLSGAAESLSSSGKEFPDPSKSYQTLGELLDTQRCLEHILRELGQWHRSTTPGCEYVPNDDESTAAVLDVVAELETATAQAGVLAETLDRACQAASVIGWYGNPADD